jgi:hypothetical protein
MGKYVSLVPILSVSFLLTAGCDEYLDLEPDDRPPAVPPDAGPPDPPADDAGPGYPLLPPREVFPDAPVVTMPPDAPVPPPAGSVDEGVHLVFPPAASITTAHHVSMRGTARLPGGVTAVRVNGVDARLSAPNAEGVVAWQVDVAPARGHNDLVVSVTDGDGATVPEAARATLEFAPYMLLQPTGLELDVGHDRLFVSDPGARGIVAIDLETGAPARISLAPGPDVAILPRMLSIDAAAGRAVALSHDVVCTDEAESEVWMTLGIDLQDGSFDIEDRFEAMPDCNGVYDELESYDSAVVIAPGQDAFFAAHEECEYEYVDDVRRRKCTIDVRERRLGGGAPAAGVPLCTDIECSVVDMIADRRGGPAGFGLLALVNQGGVFEVRAIDPAARVQTSIAAIRTGWDDDDLEPAAMALDLANDRLLVLARGDYDRVYVIGIDLAGGAQTLLVARSATADGIELEDAADAVYDPRRGRLIVSAPYLGLFAVDLATGVATALFRPAIGDGPTPLCAQSWLGAPGRPQRRCDISTFDSQRQRFFVHEPRDEGGRIYVVDLTTGDRHLLSESGMEYSSPTLLADFPEDRVLILQNNGALYAIDGATGAQTALVVSPSLANVNRNPSAWDPERDRILYMPYVIGEEVYELRAYHVNTDEDRLLSSDSVGSGPSLRPADAFRPSASELIVTLDASGTRAFVSHLFARSLVGVDLGTGNRTGHAVGEPAGSPGYASCILADARRNRLLVGDVTGQDLVAVDLATGASDTFVDFGPRYFFVFADELIPDHARDRALMVDERGDVHLLDLQTGEHVLILRGTP